ncbi:MAG: RpiB/LacA/LacB family sugar-phosphate isomerase [Rikenellaceae bacterium]|jgi:ribose 5-phosphate isomerase B|nr:RpiB/LacA/LacB family sugar-phosphate isomerase [Rikenellaceae bacterium]
MEKKIGLACDHAGYEMKEFIAGYLDAKGYDVHDFGCDSPESCDYPDMAHALAESIEKGEVPVGIALCGSGNGISMSLNKHADVRAALCWNVELAELARQHNNANVLSLPARFIDNSEAIAMIDKFLSTNFDPTAERHVRRVNKIAISK